MTQALKQQPPPEFGVSETAAREEIAAGLMRAQAEVAPKYFYDPLGSKLFEAITQLPEYYPTRTERAIFEKHGGEIADAVGTGRVMIDLGAGNCDKARRLFPELRPAVYVAVDVSAEFLRGALRELSALHPDVQMQALGMDFSAHLDFPASVPSERRLFFYPGSSIGNFAPQAAAALLARVREQCGGSGSLLIGFDLVKSPALLEAAYDDALGVTAAFNLNLLNHLNQLLRANFNLAGWRHRAVYNAPLARIEMHLDALRDVTVTWADGERRFRQGESIHTECSHKYQPLQFRAMLVQAGFKTIHTWTDEKHWFGVCHASV